MNCGSFNVFGLSAVFMALLVSGSVVAKESNRVNFFLEAASHSYSEPVPISLFEDDLKSTLKPLEGEDVLTFSRLQVGARYGQFAISVFVREEYAFHFSNDTFALLYADKNNLPLVDGETYNLDLDVSHIRVKGMTLAFRLWQSNEHVFNIVTSWLQASDLLTGSIRGVVEKQGSIFQGDLAVDYHYNEDYLLDRDLSDWSTRNGYGFSLGFNAQFEWFDRLTLKLDWPDLLGAIYWQKAPYTDVRVSSTYLYYDENDLPHRAPIMSGKEDFESFYQALPIYNTLDLSWRLTSRLEIGWQREQYERVVFNNTDVNWYMAEQTPIFLGYEWLTHAYRVGIRSPYGHLLLATDDWDLDKSHAAQVELGVSWRF